MTAADARAGGARRNVELKARDPDPARTLERALAAGALDRGVLEQRDTYFAVPRGRLKLREEPGRRALLIPYERADAAEAKLSSYRLLEVPDAAALRDALAATVGVRAVVEKSRRLLVWEETVRIHLDDVRRLGRFVEIEAVAADRSGLAREREQVARLAALLTIVRADLVSVGYADLIVG